MLYTNWLIVSAEPASACSHFTTKIEGVDQEKEDVKRVSPSLQGFRTPGGTNIWMGTSETSSETEQPQEKRAKREAGEEELEEGELMDSSEEEKEEEEGNGEDNTQCNKSCDHARGLADDIEEVKYEPGDINVDGGIKKHSDSSRDQCINENMTGPTGCSSAATQSAEFSVIKQDTVKESGLVQIHHCQDENESANAADSCGLE